MTVTKLALFAAAWLAALIFLVIVNPPWIRFGAVALILSAGIGSWWAGLEGGRREQ